VVTRPLHVSANPFLRDNHAPIDVETTSLDLQVTGHIPSGLNGRYLRDGNADWYRNRWVRSARVARALGEPIPASDWPADHADFAANTNVIGHAGKTFAVVEGGSPPTPNETRERANCMSWPTGGDGGIRRNI